MVKFDLNESNSDSEFFKEKRISKQLSLDSDPQTPAPKMGILNKLSHSFFAGW